MTPTMATQQLEKTRLMMEHGGAVARIVLDDGKGNVLDHVMMESLQQILDGLKDKPDVKLITFEGSGKHFSFGASVEEHQKDMAPTMLRSFHALFFTIRDLSIPTLARISGQCLGGGMELAIMCDFLFADQSARLGQPEIVLGVFPPPASVILPEKIGLSRATDLLLTGRTIDAQEAHAIGLVNAVVADRAALEAHVEAFIVAQILPKSASSLRFGVKAARVKFNHVLGNFLPTLEQLYVNQLMNTADANEGITAFIEKRAAKWTNR
ncbi:MAG: enoyl-CoA hydratase/isomerase family protein [Flavobacteriales bacterium]|jgi:cyclohexa-1,5-dienecarbonyl-CoA hydratase|nr:enoyl-CoA hydratase/isomerase family protein [Flavobacteriales bacterium]MBK7247380.1 enoyl-CoA hydratase/isomerase family protein [Flavobacteriales bacterium]MBK7286413.1 enoyl-CoA hydratase/isomerase family protein [Flavobacteriales bacterium]QQS72673.1 MAG: enoyl-CoA hydratase/isomerase family protein [Flavobacteriales bacterium]HQV38062.1 enoyl-CoA hydratase-related protein [Flavobacteriales bacterium]